jgi:hypothetical protein
LGDRSIAWMVVLAWHLLVVRWLLHALPAMQRTREDPAIQVVYVSRPPAARPQRVLPAHGSRRSAAHSPRQPSQVAPPRATMVARAIPLSAPVLLDPTLVVAQPLPALPPDPFADHPPRLPGEGPGRFRMRDPITPARAVAWLGSHILAPRGYTADPCARNRANIGNLMSGQDPSALQQEIDFQRRHCLP